jgi:hypothetical protein
MNQAKAFCRGAITSSGSLHVLARQFRARGSKEGDAVVFKFPDGSIVRRSGSLLEAVTVVTEKYWIGTGR